MKYSDQTVVNHLNNVNNGGGVVTFDVALYRYGTISALQLNQLKVVKSVVRDGDPLPVNLATSSTVTASSEFNSTFAKTHAVDGIIGKDGDGEWASLGELTPWIQLTWGSSQTINDIKLYDRPNLTDSISAGTLTFSDGSSITVGALDNAGAVKDISFANKTVTCILSYHIE